MFSRGPHKSSICENLMHAVLLQLICDPSENFAALKSDLPVGQQFFAEDGQQSDTGVDVTHSSVCKARLLYCNHDKILLFPSEIFRPRISVNSANC